MAEHRLRGGSNLIQNGVLLDHQSLLEGHVIRYLPGFEYRPLVLGIPFKYGCRVFGIPWYPPGISNASRISRTSFKVHIVKQKGQLLCHNEMG